MRQRQGDRDKEKEVVRKKLGDSDKESRQGGKNTGTEVR